MPPFLGVCTKYVLSPCPFAFDHHRWSLHQVGVNFMDCNPALVMGHHHIIVATDYFMKWEEAMPIVNYDGETATHFVSNQIIIWFGILKDLSLTMVGTFRTK